MDRERYLRQILMPEIGEAGQKKLASASVLALGAGGLGSALLFNLAGLGIGRLTVIDPDSVSLSDLNRQFLYTEGDIGKSKALAAKARLSAFNSQCKIEALETKLTADNAQALLCSCDIALLAVDNMEARLTANRICCKKGIPLINGGVEGFLGSLAIVEPGKTPCLECLYGEKPPAFSGEKHLAAAPAVSAVASLMAQSALLMLLGQGNPLGEHILYMDLNTFSFERIAVSRREDCAACGGC